MKGKLFGFLGIRSNRTKNITIHVFSSLFYKLGSVASSLLLIPLTMDCICTEDYGIWLIISTSLSWFTLVDGGLGNGLRNKFAETKALGDFALAKAYVSTSYISTSVLLLFVSTVFFVFSDVINWAALFNCSTQLSKDLSLLVPVTIAFFSMQ